jgi:hypothetical protein
MSALEVAQQATEVEEAVEEALSKLDEIDRNLLRRCFNLEPREPESETWRLDRFSDWQVEAACPDLLRKLMGYGAEKVQ